MSNKNKFFSSLVLITALVLIGCNKVNTSPQASKLYGLASPIQLTPDTTKVILSDYFPTEVKIDSIISDDAIQISFIGNLLFLVPKIEAIKPLSNLTIFAEGIPYSILVKAPKTIKTTIRFDNSLTRFKEIRIKGQFSNWILSEPLKESKENKGEYFITLDLKPRKYQYKLVADGKEINHPNVAEEPNGMGGTNNIITIAGISKREKSIISTDSFTSSKIFISSENTDEIYAYWNNYRISSEKENNTFKVQIPPFAKYELRSHIRIVGYNQKSTSNDILIPLEKGKVFMDCKKLNNNDWHSSIMYFMMVDRFKDGDTLNNIIVNDERILPQAQYQGGDIKGIIQKIKDGYFQNLGINTIWISPITQNPTDAWGQFKDPSTKFSGYHGYWPITSTTVDYRLGDPSDIRGLLNLAHKNGLSVVLDYVANHVHQDHSVYQQHKDWVTPLYLPDGRMNTELWDEQRLTTWFDTFLPTLNLMDQKVTDFMVDSAVFWIKEYDFDGIRHDATKHIPENYWRALTQKVKNIGKEKGKYIYQIGETYGGHGLINSYVSSGLLDAQFDFNMYDNALPVFAKPKESFKRLSESLQASLSTYGHHHLMGNITGNQDKPRFISYADGSIEFDIPMDEYKRFGWKNNIMVTDTLAYRKMALFNAYNISIPGIPIMYYGDEIGMPGAGDPDNRRMMRFNDVNPQEKTLREELSSLLKIRQENMALLYGSTEIMHTADDLLVIKRKYFNNEVIILINKGATESSIGQKKQDKVLFNLTAPGYSYTIDIKN